MKNLDSEFLQDYRAGALRTAFYAALAASLVFVAFLSVSIASERPTSIATTVRLLLVLILLGTAAVIRFAPDFARKWYTQVTGAASASALGGTVLLLSIGSDGTPHADAGASPAVMFGLFLHYAFLRLPIRVAAGIGWIVSAIALGWGAPMVIGGNAAARSVLYLVFANIAGMLICRSLESRERELFAQRRRAEAAQAELAERARAAEEAHMEKTRLLAAVSHDLRQPMMAARAYLGKLSSRLLRGDVEQAHRQAGLLGESIDMLGATLDHLLTAARYDSGTEPIRIEVVELEPILRRLRETFAAEAAAKGLELRIRVPDRRIVVTTDATALWRVLMNLVSNSIKFTPGNGRPGRGVLIKVGLQGGTCRIDVADTGIGIPRCHFEEIWQPYFQVANAERNRERGLGLGLFLVRRALDHLPGHALDLRSRAGRGSRFTLRLPGMWFNQPDLAEGSPNTVLADDLEVMRGGYVLLLEDDRDARRALQELLADWEIVYASGATLEELLESLGADERIADVLVTDYRLPGRLSGIDCINTLRERFGVRIPAVLITGESDVQSIRCRLPAETTLLQKPFDPSLLAAPLAEAIRNARLRELSEANRV